MPQQLETCTDIDECSTNLNRGIPPCGAGGYVLPLQQQVEHVCVNNEAARGCECAVGFELEAGRPASAPRCVPINYCRNQPCGPPPNKCQSFLGTYSCQCGSGFEIVWSGGAGSAGGNDVRKRRMDNARFIPNFGLSVAPRPAKLTNLNPN